MTSLLAHHGYLAIALLAFIEACCVPIPSEITFAFGGVLAHEGHLSLAGLIVIGTVAELLGSLVSYGVGRVGGRPAVDRLGRFVLLTRTDLDRAERWFSGRGEFAIAIGRMTPVLRAFVSIVAGVGDMPVVRFVLCSLAGTACYATALSLLGYNLASAWHSVVHDFSIAGYLIIALAVVGLVFVVRLRLKHVRADAALRSSEAR